MGYDIGPGPLELRHQRREVGRARRIAFPQHELQAAFLAELLRRLRYAHPVGSVLVQNRDFDSLWLDPEPRFGVLRDKCRESLTILIGVNLGAEHVLAILVLKHRGRYRRGDPKNLLLRLDLGGERHGMRAGINAEHDFDLLLIDQPLDLVDGSIRLALRIGIDRLHLVFGGDPATLIDDVDRGLRTDRTGDRPCRRERPGKIIDDADPDRRVLRASKLAAETGCRERRGRVLKERSARRYCCHDDLPMECSAPVATPQLFRGVFEEPLAESTRPSDRPPPERGPTRPEPIAHAGEEVRLRPFPARRRSA